MEAIQTALTNGGIPTYFIFLCGILLVLITIERFGVLYGTMSFDTSHAIQEIKECVLKREYAQALQICNQKETSPSLMVAKTALMDVESGREAMRSALGSSLIELSEKTEKRLPMLALIASVGTLLGLLGTITGLVKTFAAIANVDPAKKSEMLGVGISEAMYSTAAGLVVGIAALVIHTLFSSKANSIRSHARNVGLKVINWIEKSERS
ncbi:MAG TPA: MotA/TolQ/ExbB proton channel family protein [Bdellovibrionota bacterium]|jgi:biopolymer transport protein ExbB/TolQ|nr:MotA/TolQ/ExbB proton channel family protein [Bdellovibrionota bacterium]